MVNLTLLKMECGGKYAINRVGTWGKRIAKRRKGETLSKTPWSIVRRRFMKKKGAVLALLGVIASFLFVFIAPIFVSVDMQYTDALQQNVAPVRSLRTVPKELKNEVEEIQGFSGFTVGLSKSGKVFVWGNKKDDLLKINYGDIPEKIRKEGAMKTACGKDHILAITPSGEVVGWGDKSCGQYGEEFVLNALPMPEMALHSGEEVRDISCGYQSSALVKTDGTLYVWGNLNVTKNLTALSDLTGVKQVEFTNSAGVVLFENGEVTTGGSKIFTSAVSSRHGKQDSFTGYLEEK